MSRTRNPKISAKNEFSVCLLAFKFRPLGARTKNTRNTERGLQSDAGLKKAKTANNPLFLRPLLEYLHN